MNAATLIDRRTRVASTWLVTKTWLAALLRRCAARLAPPLPIAPPRVLPPDMQTWFDALPEAVRQRVPQTDADLHRLRVMLMLLPVLPSAQAFATYLDRVPEWTRLHKRFGAVLLARIAECDRRGIALDERFETVLRWLLDRNASMTFVPMRFDDAWRAACDGYGADLAALAHDFRQRRRLPQRPAVSQRDYPRQYARAAAPDRLGAPR